MTLLVPLLCIRSEEWLRWLAPLFWDLGSDVSSSVMVAGPCCLMI